MNTYTVADYEKLSGEDRWELIRGVFQVFMSPSPQASHQNASIALGSALYILAKKKKYKVFTAPFDVELSRDTVVQPDLFVVRDLKKLTKKRCVGSPDLIVEILSKSSVKRDTVDKLELYESHGIAEYWIVDPDKKRIFVYVLEGDKYSGPVTYTKKDTVVSSIDPEIAVSLKEVL